MKYLPLNTSDFNKMMTENYVYVDKTEHIYNLFSGGTYCYFLSRPRRFGKSLLISTLKEFFLGNKELFKDLWVGSSNYQWQKHPVIHIDFGAMEKTSPETLRDSLIWELTGIAKTYNIDIHGAPNLSSKFKYLIEQLTKINKVVLLIDEYDKPILDNLSNKEIAIAMRDILKSFYDVLKSVDSSLRAIFITGVTKFARTSIFSGLNNLNDLTMDERAATLLGYTKEELEHYFNQYIEELAKNLNISTSDAYAKIKTYYNGYRFSAKETYVYNPYSALQCLDKKKFSNYWFGSGTPTFLITILQQQGKKLENIETVELTNDSLGAIDIGSIHIFPLLFQTGYLTIQEYYPEEGPDQNNHITPERYILRFPNFEVQDSFEKYLMAAFIESAVSDIDAAVGHFKQALKNNDIELFCTTLRTLFANIPHQLQLPREAYYHSLLQLLITLLGLEGSSEINTSQGSIDMVLKTNSRIYVFEFKFNKTGEEALKQIMDRKYYEKYMQKNKQIILVGLSFNMKNKELALDWMQRQLTTEN